MDDESWQRLQALQPTVEEPLNLTPPPEQEAQPANGGPGLGRLWWIGGGGLLVLLAGALFILLLKAFAEEVDDPDAPLDEMDEMDEMDESESTAQERVPPRQKAPKSPETTRDEPPLPVSPQPDSSIQDSPPQESPQDASSDSTPEAFPDLPSEPVAGLNDAVAPQTTAIAPPNSSSHGLTRLPRMSIVEALILDLQHPDPQRRHKAIWELGQRGDSRAISPLVELLTDASSQERNTILAVLSEISSRNLQPIKQALMVSLQDDSPEVRKNAIRDLTRIYDSIAQLSQVLRYGTDDSDPDVRETAKWAMSQLQRIRTLPLNSDGDKTP